MSGSTRVLFFRFLFVVWYFEWRVSGDDLLTIALDHLIIGRAQMATSPPDLIAAKQHLQAAVDGLRASGEADPRPRPPRSRRIQDNLELAKHDLDEVRTIVRCTGMQLFEADL